jgi:predicted ATPase/class 3 adenylate cyclase
MESTSSFGYWIRRQRKALDLTQQALADRVGCSLAAIKKIEGDERRPSRQIAEGLADILMVPKNQRERFIEVARGIRPADQLLLAHEQVNPTRPSGTVTFLFTDIEGSTKLAQEYTDELPSLLARHREILTKAIAAHNGFVFQVVGDSFSAAFDTALNALQAASDAQQLLQNEAWSPAPVKVRMGIHTGTARFTEHSSMEGPYLGYATLALTQRIMSAAHGGQILLSHATENLLRDHLPKNVSLLDFGEHKVKDILQPVRIFQVLAPDLQKEFPPLSALDILPNNLPIQLTSFIGRGSELTETKQLLENNRLLTLIGAGGTGKTRLSLQIAQDVLPEFMNGVWLVELAPLTDPSLIPQTIASIVGLREQSNTALIDILTNYLRTNHLLLILDNCEHLIAACAKLCADLLRVCPQLKILASSREALGISGETVYQVPSLSLPNPALVRRETLLESESIQLFVERARAVQAHFALQDSNAIAVSQICHHLDGIPLALELAAARIAVFSPEEIASHLDDRFRLLTGGSRAALKRHQTLQASIDWSYDLLSDAERTLFRQLSVFSGGWTFEAAEAICSDLDVLVLLTQLVNKSLVLVEEHGQRTRYRLPETIRQYARDKLFEAGESNTMRNHHLGYYLKLAEGASPHLRKWEQIEWLNQLDAEYENLRASLAWAMNQPSAESALRLVAALGTFWDIRAHWLEGANWIDQALTKEWNEKHRPEKVARAKALYLRTDFAEALDEPDRMKTCAETALVSCKEVDDAWGAAYAQAKIASYMMQNGEYSTSKVLFDKSLEEFHQLGDAWGESFVLSRLSVVEANLGKTEKYAEYLQNALALVRASGDRDRIIRSLINIAASLLYYSEWDQVENLLQEADQLSTELGSSSGIARARYYRAQVFLARGKLEDAKMELKIFSDWCLHVGDKIMQARCSLLLGLIAEIENKIGKAREYLQHGLSLARETGLSNPTVQLLAFLGRLEYQQENHKIAIQYLQEALALVKNGQVSGDELLLVFCQVSGIWVETKPQIAVQLLGCTEAFWQSARIPRNSTFDKPYFERFLSAARTKLSEAEFNKAWEAGLNMSEKQALAFVMKELND